MSRAPRNFLGATKKIGDLDIAITKIELEHGISAGIGLQTWFEELIPPFEEHAARLEMRFTQAEWDGMDYWDKVIIVAHRRTRLAMHNLQEEAQIKKINKTPRKK